MTDEYPWQTGGLDHKPKTEAADALESLGFTFSEKFSGHSDVGHSVAQNDAENVDQAVARREPAPAPSRYVDVATAPLDSVAATQPTDLVPMSRKALRESERARPSSRPRRGSATNALSKAPSSAPSGSLDSSFFAAPAVTFPSGYVEKVRPAAAPVAVAPPQRPDAPKPSLRRRIAKKTFPPVVMLATAALLVGTSVPATALFDPDAPPASTVMATISTSVDTADPAVTEDQVVDVEAAGELTATVASRDEWSVTSYAELLRLRYGSRSFSYSTSGSGAVRWPFPVAVPISSGFGERAAPCRGCSSYHQGLDFNPGAGTPIFAIADGIVIRAEHSGGFGNHAIVQHVVNGQRVTSTYAHMTRDSSPLAVGQEIRVGDFVGTVGSTGASTGAHLHFEIGIDDIAIDPFAWLQSNAS